METNEEILGQTLKFKRDSNGEYDCLVELPRYYKLVSVWKIGPACWNARMDDKDGGVFVVKSQATREDAVRTCIAHELKEGGEA